MHGVTIVRTITSNPTNRKSVCHARSSCVIIVVENELFCALLYSYTRSSCMICTLYCNCMPVDNHLIDT